MAEENKINILSLLIGIGIGALALYLIFRPQQQQMSRYENAENWSIDRSPDGHISNLMVSRDATINGDNDKIHDNIHSMGCSCKNNHIRQQNPIMSQYDPIAHLRQKTYRDMYSMEPVEFHRKYIRRSDWKDYFGVR